MCARESFSAARHTVFLQGRAVNGVELVRRTRLYGNGHVAHARPGQGERRGRCGRSAEGTV